MPTQERTVFLGTKMAAQYVGLSYHSFKKIVAAGGIKPIIGTKKFRKADLDQLVGHQEGGGNADTTRAE